MISSSGVVGIRRAYRAGAGHRRHAIKSARTRPIDRQSRQRSDERAVGAPPIHRPRLVIPVAGCSSAVLAGTARYTPIGERASPGRLAPGHRGGPGSGSAKAPPITGSRCSAATLAIDAALEADGPPRRPATCSAPLSRRTAPWSGCTGLLVWRRCRHCRSRSPPRCPCALSCLRTAPRRPGWRRRWPPCGRSRRTTTSAATPTFLLSGSLV